MKNKRKKVLAILKLLFILILTNIIYEINSYANLNTTELEIGQNLEFTIDFGKNIKTADFSVNYDQEKLTYMGASTEDLKTNFISDTNEIISCYYDLNKEGTDKIILKFKAKEETDKTNIKITNITIHTEQNEEEMNDITSENINITRKLSNENSENIKTSSTTTTDEINKTQSTISKENNVNDDTISVKPLPRTGTEITSNILLLSLIGMAIICFICAIEFNKLHKILISGFGIIVIGSAFLNNNVLADMKYKIFINKEDKNMLIVLSTSNKNRSMSIDDFKAETKAIEFDKDKMISGIMATFKNGEKYIIDIYGDRNKDGIINSSDIFEILNSENVSEKDIIELSNFIIKKEEFQNYDIDNKYEEFNENSIITPSITPLKPANDRYVEIKNVEELKKINANIGDKYKTLGYYQENDGGNGRYDIIEDSQNLQENNGTYIKLDNGLIAKLLVKDKTINVKQFGAIGNGINDDTVYLNEAFNSGINNIEIPNGEYKITDIIKLNTENTNILGNNSTIFTDNSFSPKKISEFLFIMETDNCNIKDLKIEARETEYFEQLYKSQLYVGATNIQIKNCKIIIPETASSDYSYGNIDLYTGWHNVLIENCELYLGNDSKKGGCIWIRDLFNRGASDVTFINNKCYKKTHDEILAVFMGSIENVNILNNNFIMEESTDPSTMAFTLGSASSKKAQNIRFEGNNIDVKATMDLIVSRNATNLSIKNNKVKFERITTDTNTFVIYFPEDNLENVSIENNEFEINNNTGKAINGLILTKFNNLIFKNNTAVINSEVLEAFTGGINNINNNITFNDTVNILVNKPKEFESNNFIFNKGFGAIAQYYLGEIDWESNIRNNTFENNFDEISADGKSILIMFNRGTLNNHIVNFEGNIVKSEKANYRRNLIYLLNLSDVEGQTIKIVNNKLEGYKTGWKDENQDIHNIILENNS